MYDNMTVKLLKKSVGFNKKACRTGHNKIFEGGLDCPIKWLNSIRFLESNDPTILSYMFQMTMRPTLLRATNKLFEFAIALWRVFSTNKFLQ